MEICNFCSVNLRKSNQNSSCLCIRDLSLGHRRGHSTQTTCPQRHHLQPQKLGSSILPRFAPSSFHSSWHPPSSILHPASRVSLHSPLWYFPCRCIAFSIWMATNFQVSPTSWHLRNFQE